MSVNTVNEYNDAPPTALIYTLAGGTLDLSISYTYNTDNSGVYNNAFVNATNAGTYYVRAYLAGTANYEGFDETATLTIKPLEWENGSLADGYLGEYNMYGHTTAYDMVTYNMGITTGSEYVNTTPVTMLSYALGGGTLNINVVYTYSIGGSQYLPWILTGVSNSGTYNVKASIAADPNGNYEAVELAATLTINPLTWTEGNVADGNLGVYYFVGATKVYDMMTHYMSIGTVDRYYDSAPSELTYELTGGTLSLTVNYTYNNNLVDNGEYPLSFVSATNAGTYNVRAYLPADPNGNYGELDKTATLTINPLTWTAGALADGNLGALSFVGPDGAQVYDGLTHYVSVTRNNNAWVDAMGADFTYNLNSGLNLTIPVVYQMSTDNVSWTAFNGVKNAKTYYLKATIAPEANGNYEGRTFNYTYVITPFETTINWTLPVGNTSIYNGTNQHSMLNVQLQKVVAEGGLSDLAFHLYLASDLSGNYSDLNNDNAVVTDLTAISVDSVVTDSLTGKTTYQYYHAGNYVAVAYFHDDNYALTNSYQLVQTLEMRQYVIPLYLVGSSFIYDAVTHYVSANTSDSWLDIRPESNAIALAGSETGTITYKYNTDNSGVYSSVFNGARDAATYYIQATITVGEGYQSSDYVAWQKTAVLDIAHFDLNLSSTGTPAWTKIYDGTDAYTAFTLNEIPAGDAGKLTISVHFDNKNAGIGKTIVVELTDTDVSSPVSQNYYSESITTGVIERKELVLIGNIVWNKTYDGTDNAVPRNAQGDIVDISGSAAYTAGNYVISGDEVTVSAYFDSKNVDNVTKVYFGLAGADAANYYVMEVVQSNLISPVVTPVIWTNPSLTYNSYVRTYEAYVTNCVEGRVSAYPYTIASIELLGDDINNPSLSSNGILMFDIVFTSDGEIAVYKNAAIYNANVSADDHLVSKLYAEGYLFENSALGNYYTIEGNYVLWDIENSSDTTAKTCEITKCPITVEWTIDESLIYRGEELTLEAYTSIVGADCGLYGSDANGRIDFAIIPENTELDDITGVALFKGAARSSSFKNAGIYTIIAQLENALDANYQLIDSQKSNVTVDKANIDNYFNFASAQVITLESYFDGVEHYFFVTDGNGDYKHVRTYSPYSTYAVGDYCIYGTGADRVVYVSNTTISGEAWTPEHWAIATDVEVAKTYQYDSGVPVLVYYSTGDDIEFHTVDGGYASGYNGVKNAGNYNISATVYETENYYGWSGNFDVTIAKGNIDDYIEINDRLTDGTTGREGDGSPLIYSGTSYYIYAAYAGGYFNIDNFALQFPDGSVMAINYNLNELQYVNGVYPTYNNGVVSGDYVTDSNGNPVYLSGGVQKSEPGTDEVGFYQILASVIDNQNYNDWSDSAILRIVRYNAMVFWQTTYEGEPTDVNNVVFTYNGVDQLTNISASFSAPSIDLLPGETNIRLAIVTQVTENAAAYEDNGGNDHEFRLAGNYILNAYVPASRSNQARINRNYNLSGITTALTMNKFMVEILWYIDVPDGNGNERSEYDEANPPEYDSIEYNISAVGHGVQYTSDVVNGQPVYSNSTILLFTDENDPDSIWSAINAGNGYSCRVIGIDASMREQINVYGVEPPSKYPYYSYNYELSAFNNILSWSIRRRNISVELGADANELRKYYDGSDEFLITSIAGHTASYEYVVTDQVISRNGHTVKIYEEHGQVYVSGVEGYNYISYTIRGILENDTYQQQVCPICDYTYYESNFNSYTIDTDYSSINSTTLQEAPGCYTNDGPVTLTVKPSVALVVAGVAYSEGDTIPAGSRLSANQYFYLDEADRSGFYNGIIIDGVLYRQGDTIGAGTVLDYEEYYYLSDTDKKGFTAGGFITVNHNGTRWDAISAAYECPVCKKNAAAEAEATIADLRQQLVFYDSIVNGTYGFVRIAELIDYLYTLSDSATDLETKLVYINACLDVFDQLDSDYYSNKSAYTLTQPPYNTITINSRGYGVGDTIPAGTLITLEQYYDLDEDDRDAFALTKLSIRNITKHNYSALYLLKAQILNSLAARYGTNNNNWNKMRVTDYADVKYLVNMIMDLDEAISINVPDLTTNSLHNSLRVLINNLNTYAQTLFDKSEDLIPLTVEDATSVLLANLAGNGTIERMSATLSMYYIYHSFDVGNDNPLDDEIDNYHVIDDAVYNLGDLIDEQITDVKVSENNDGFDISISAYESSYVDYYYQRMYSLMYDMFAGETSLVQDRMESFIQKSSTMIRNKQVYDEIFEGDENIVDERTIIAARLNYNAMPDEIKKIVSFDYYIDLAEAKIVDMLTNAIAVNLTAPLYAPSIEMIGDIYYIYGIYANMTERGKSFVYSIITDLKTDVDAINVTEQQVRDRIQNTQYTTSTEASVENITYARLLYERFKANNPYTEIDTLINLEGAENALIESYTSNILGALPVASLDNTYALANAKYWFNKMSAVVQNQANNAYTLKENQHNNLFDVDITSSILRDEEYLTIATAWYKALPLSSQMYVNYDNILTTLQAEYIMLRIAMLPATVTVNGMPTVSNTVSGLDIFNYNYARAAFDNSPAEVCVMVNNLTTLEDFAAAIAALDGAVDADTIIQAILAIPMSVTLANLTQITTARSAYDAGTDAARSTVAATTYNGEISCYDYLLNAEARAVELMLAEYQTVASFGNDATPQERRDDVIRLFVYYHACNTVLTDAIKVTLPNIELFIASVYSRLREDIKSLAITAKSEFVAYGDYILLQPENITIYDDEPKRVSNVSATNANIVWTRLESDNYSLETDAIGTSGVTNIPAQIMPLPVRVYVGTNNNGKIYDGETLVHNMTAEQHVSTAYTYVDDDEVVHLGWDDVIDSINAIVDTNGIPVLNAITDLVEGNFLVANVSIAGYNYRNEYVDGVTDASINEGQQHHNYIVYSQTDAVAGDTFVFRTYDADGYSNYDFVIDDGLLVFDSYTVQTDLTITEQPAETLVINSVMYNVGDTVPALTVLNNEQYNLLGTADKAFVKGNFGTYNKMNTDTTTVLEIYDGVVGAHEFEESKYTISKRQLTVEYNNLLQSWQQSAQTIGINALKDTLADDETNNITAEEFNRLMYQDNFFDSQFNVLTGDSSAITVYNNWMDYISSVAVTLTGAPSATLTVGGVTYGIGNTIPKGTVLSMAQYLSLATADKAGFIPYNGFVNTYGVVITSEPSGVLKVNGTVYNKDNVIPANTVLLNEQYNMLCEADRAYFSSGSTYLKVVGNDDDESYNLYVNMRSERNAYNYNYNMPVLQIVHLKVRDSALYYLDVSSADDLQRMGSDLDGLRTARNDLENPVGEIPTLYQTGNISGITDLGYVVVTTMPFFDGIYEGNNYMITDLLLSAVGSDGGLFGTIHGTTDENGIVTGGIVRNVTLKNVVLAASSNTVKTAGIIAGKAEGGLIQNVDVMAKIDINTTHSTDTAIAVGGIVGDARDLSMSDVTFTGRITVTDTNNGISAGGLIGSYQLTEPMDSAPLDDVYSFATIAALSYPAVADANNLGGVIGSTDATALTDVLGSYNYLANSLSVTVRTQGDSIIGYDQNAAYEVGAYVIHNNIPYVCVESYDPTLFENVMPGWYGKYWHRAYFDYYRIENSVCYPYTDATLFYNRACNNVSDGGSAAVSYQTLVAGGSDYYTAIFNNVTDYLMKDYYFSAGDFSVVNNTRNVATIGISAATAIEISNFRQLGYLKLFPWLTYAIDNTDIFIPTYMDDDGDLVEGSGYVMHTFPFAVNCVVTGKNVVSETNGDLTVYSLVYSSNALNTLYFITLVAR